jgi:hypothetical protein
VVGEDTHFSGLGGDVDLDTVGGGRQYAFKSCSELSVVDERGVGRHVHAGRLEDSLFQDPYVSFQSIRRKGCVQLSRIVPGEEGPEKA